MPVTDAASNLLDFNPCAQKKRHLEPRGCRALSMYATPTPLPWPSPIPSCCPPQHASVTIMMSRARACKMLDGGCWTAVAGRRRFFNPNPPHSKLRFTCDMRGMESNHKVISWHDGHKPNDHKPGGGDHFCYVARPSIEPEKAAATRQRRQQQTTNAHHPPTKRIVKNEGKLREEPCGKM